MVQALRDLIEDSCFDEASLTEALSTFECVYSGDESEDVTSFLVKDAIRLEREAITRTYLIINDERWEEGCVQIDGYFSIAIKVIYFHGVDLGILENAFGNGSQKNCPAFLIGQLARGVHSPKGSGAEYLKKALSYVASVKDIIGGRFVYLDCVPERRTYYETQGFAFLKNKHNSPLIQMYKII